MIRGITNNYDVNFMYSNPVAPQKQPQQPRSTATNKQNKTSSKIARNVSIGAAVVAAAGGIAYYLKTGKKAKPDILKKGNDIVEDISEHLKRIEDDIADDITGSVDKNKEDIIEDIPETPVEKAKDKIKNVIQHIIPFNKETGAFKYNVMNGDTFIKSVESDGYTPSSDLLIQNGLERQIYTQWADGRTATTQDLLTPDKKVYERMTVRGDDIFRYNFAYKDGKAAGYAKEHTQHGFQHNISPMTVKMYDGKEVKASNVWELFDAEPTFDPRVTQK